VVYGALFFVVLFFEGCTFLVVVFHLFGVVGEFCVLFASAQCYTQFRIPFLSFLLFFSLLHSSFGIGNSTFVF
jgi:hypothetical protein